MLVGAPSGAQPLPLWLPRTPPPMCWPATSWLAWLLLCRWFTADIKAVNRSATPWLLVGRADARRETVPEGRSGPACPCRLS